MLARPRRRALRRRRCENGDEDAHAHGNEDGYGNGNGNGYEDVEEGGIALSYGAVFSGSAAAGFTSGVLAFGVCLLAGASLVSAINALDKSTKPNAMLSNRPGAFGA